jgi:hypothetical protein
VSQDTWEFREEEDNPDEAERGDSGTSRSVEDIDLQTLAEEVYALLRRELRLERERQGRRRT